MKAGSLQLNNHIIRHPSFRQYVGGGVTLRHEYEINNHSDRTAGSGLASQIRRIVTLKPITAGSASGSGTQTRHQLYAPFRASSSPLNARLQSECGTFNRLRLVMPFTPSGRIKDIALNHRLI